MTPERAKEIDEYLLASLADGPRYLDMGHSPVEAIERCFALIDEGKVYMRGDWVYLVSANRGSKECQSLTQKTSTQG